MRVFICTDHDSVRPTGVASVIVATTKAKAVGQLDEALQARGLKPSSEHPFTLKEVSTKEPSATILQDGDY